MLIPAYNAAAFLPRLLASAAAQTEAFDEIWVYDDCSIDDTAAVAEELGAKVVRGDENRGCSHGKNVLANLTRCEWLHFHDADDDLRSNFVALARRWMASGQFDVVLFPYEEVDDDTNERIAVRTFDPNDVAADARSYAIREQINPFCGLYRRTTTLSQEATMRIHSSSTTRMSRSISVWRSPASHSPQSAKLRSSTGVGRKRCRPPMCNDA